MLPGNTYLSAVIIQDTTWKYLDTAFSISILGSCGPTYPFEPVALDSSCPFRKIAVGAVFRLEECAGSYLLPGGSLIVMGSMSVVWSIIEKIYGGQRRL